MTTIIRKAVTEKKIEYTVILADTDCEGKAYERKDSVVYDRNTATLEMWNRKKDCAEWGIYASDNTPDIQMSLSDMEKIIYDIQSILYFETCGEVSFTEMVL